MGDLAPLYDSAAAVTKAVTGAGYSGGYVTSVVYTILETFTTCDVLTVRWQLDSKASSAAELYVSRDHGS